jgi:hypothetical protein
MGRHGTFNRRQAKGIALLSWVDILYGRQHLQIVREMPVVAGTVITDF